jgi:predicted TIM-barrel fold metal-dependent hydrolase
MLIDAHTHIFPEVKGSNREGPTKGVGYGRVAVGDKQIQVLPPLCSQTIHTAEMLLCHMDYVGIDRTILLQGPFYGECNGFVRAAVRNYPDRFTGFAYLDPWLPQSRSSFEEICIYREFLGVKLEFSEATGLCGIHPGSKLDDHKIDWLWDGLQIHNMVLVVDLGAVGSTSYQTSGLRQVAIDFPELTIVIAHLAQPSPAVMSDKDARKLWREQIELGLLPNIYFDTAAVPAYVAEEGYPFPTAGQYIREAIGHIGAGKVMWGTDVPALLSIATYMQLLCAAREHLSSLEKSAHLQVLGDNALKVFKQRW